jgi:hypothetical protein
MTWRQRLTAQFPAARTNVKQAMVMDVEAVSPKDAQEMGCDILRHEGQIG